MPVYNAGDYLKDAIDSVIRQSLSDFDFIIIDDGSTDGSREIIRSYSDHRIKFYENDTNLGVAATLNKGIAFARSTYIMRMDSDDICDPDRLKIQSRFMDANPSVGLSGSWVWNFNSAKRFLLKYPVGKNCINAYFLFANPLSHPSVSIRRDLLITNALRYDEDFTAAQDYDLWNRCKKHTEIENINKPLVSWRRNRHSVTWGNSSLSNKKTNEILKRQLAKLNMHPSRDNLQFHREVGNGSGARTISELDAMYSWLESLINANKAVRAFSNEGIKQAAAFVWFRTCLNTSGLGLKVIKTYLRSSLRKWYTPDHHEYRYLLVNALLRINKEPTGRVSDSSPENSGHSGRN